MGANSVDMQPPELMATVDVIDLHSKYSCGTLHVVPEAVKAVRISTHKAAVVRSPNKQCRWSWRRDWRRPRTRFDQRRARICPHERGRMSAVPGAFDGEVHFRHVALSCLSN